MMDLLLLILVMIPFLSRERPTLWTHLFYFNTMSGFVTRFDDISNGNNDMSIFEYLLLSQHFPLIAPPAPTTHVCDVDDVGDTDDPLGGQSECDYDTEDKKVTPISGSIELIDFGARDQPRELVLALPYLLMRGVD